MNAELHLAFRLRDPACSELVRRYVGRFDRLRGAALHEHGARPRLPEQRGRAWSILLDASGECWSTEGFAARWREQEARGVSRVRILVGGADGWPDPAVEVDERLAFGRVTLPHQLAAAVAAEQLYRVGTILTGHPYHQGHAGGAA